MTVSTLDGEPKVNCRIGISRRREVEIVRTQQDQVGALARRDRTRAVRDPEINRAVDRGELHEALERERHSRAEAMRVKREQASMPAAITSTMTSPVPNTGSGTSSTTRGDPNDFKIAALMEAPLSGAQRLPLEIVRPG